MASFFFLVSAGIRPLAEEAVPTSGVLSNKTMASPVDFFSELLVKSPAERNQMLATKTESQRHLINAKLKEYEVYSLEQRELRLQATRLRWQLMVLMQLPPTNRAERMVNLPVQDRQQIEERLQQWDQLPPSIQKVLLANEFSSTGGHRLNAINTNPPSSTSHTTQDQSPRPGQSDIAAWDSLAPEQREKTLKRFRQFFELTESERQKTLRLLDEGQRKQAENTINVVQKMPMPQRQGYLDSVQKFSDLPPAEKERYLRMAEEWNQLKPEERQSARSYAAQLPIMPPGVTSPLSSGFMPVTNLRPLPPLPGSVTNTNKPPPMVGVDVK